MPSQRQPPARVLIDHYVRRRELITYPDATEGALDAETGQGIATHHFSQAACAAEVEVDVDTGRVRVADLLRALRGL